MTKLVYQLLMKTGSTDVLIGSSTGGLYHQGVVLPDSTLLNPLKLITWPSTAAQTLVNTTNVQTLENKTIGAGSVFYTTDSTGATTIPNYGLTRIAASAAASTYLLAAPIPGVMKFLYVAANSTAITINASTAVEIGVLGTTGAFRKIVWTRPGTVQLLGVTTAQWDVLSIGTLLVGTTTLPTFST